MARSSPGRQRLFVALWPDLLTRERLSELQAAVSASNGLLDGRVAFDNLHMTLKFLGDVPASKTAELEATLASVAFEPFTLQLDRWGQFPKPGILWLGPSQPPDGLLDVQAEAGRACEFVTRSQKEKRFRPHVTLFRKVFDLKRMQRPEAIDWLVDRLVLVRSTTHPDGVRYKVIAEFFAG